MTVTLATIRDTAAPELYPRHVLHGCASALVLFAAAFRGQQDAVWIADAGITATCVDTDADKLAEMQDAYPAGWEFVQADAFEFAATAERQWDVVSLDPFTNLMQRCADYLPLWCHVARRTVVLGTQGDTSFVAPAGWSVVEEVPRSAFRGGVFWTVLRPQGLV